MKKNKLKIGINIDSIIDESKNISKSYKDLYSKNVQIAINQKEKKLLKKKLIEEKNIEIQKKLDSILKKRKIEAPRSQAT